MILFPNVEYQLTQAEEQEAKARGLPVYNIRRSSDITPDNIERQLKFFVPYSALPAETVKVFQQQQSPSIQPSSLSSSSDLLQQYQPLVYTPNDMSIIPIQSRIPPIPKEPFDDAKTTKKVITGIEGLWYERYIHKAGVRYVMDWDSGKLVAEGEKAVKGTIQEKFHKGFGYLSKFLDVLKWGNEGLLLAQELAKLEECGRNRGKILQEFDKAEWNKQLDEEMSTAKSNIIGMMSVKAMVEAGSKMVPGKSVELLLLPVTLYGDAVVKHWIKHDLAKLKKAVGECKEKEKPPKEQEKPPIDREPPPLTDAPQTKPVNNECLGLPCGLVTVTGTVKVNTESTHDFYVGQTEFLGSKCSYEGSASFSYQAILSVDYTKEHLVFADPNPSQTKKIGKGGINADCKYYNSDGGIDFTETTRGSASITDSSGGYDDVYYTIGPDPGHDRASIVFACHPCQMATKYMPREGGLQPPPDKTESPPGRPMGNGCSVLGVTVANFVGAHQTVSNQNPVENPEYVDDDYSFSCAISFFISVGKKNAAEQIPITKNEPEGGKDPTKDPTKDPPPPVKEKKKDKKVVDTKYIAIVQGASKNETASPEIKGFDPPVYTTSDGLIIIWRNNDYFPHMVVSGNPPKSPTGAFNSGYIKPAGGLYTIVAERGTYDYHCSLHPFMTGKIQVN